MTKLNDLSWTLSNLIHLLVGDEKRMSIADWYFYIGKQIDNHIEALYDSGQLDEDEVLSIDPDFSYITDGLSSQVKGKRVIHLISNKSYNNDLKEVGNLYAWGLVTKAYNLYKGVN